MHRLPAVAFVLSAAILAPAVAQVPEADRAAFIKQDVANCVSLQRYSLPREDLPAAQYRTFCEFVFGRES